jgi:pyruvate kinase
MDRILPAHEMPEVMGRGDPSDMAVVHSTFLHHSAAGRLADAGATARRSGSGSLESGELEALMNDIMSIRAEMLNLEARFAGKIEAVDATNRLSARNLLHYLALRGHDVRQLQERLAPLGLSSLGRAEAHVMATLDAVLRALSALSGRPQDVPTPNHPVGFSEGKTLLTDHARALLRAEPAHRDVSIMVTMPSSAATDYALVRNLVASGMDIMRINCAHDTPEMWGRMVAHLRRAEQELGRRAYVLMDIAGPKLRTGAIAPGPAVVKWRPKRDVFGHITAPARIWLGPSDSPHAPPDSADAFLPVAREWLHRLEPGEELSLTDARGARRSLRVLDEAGDGWWAECGKTAYVTPGLRLRRASGPGGEGKADAVIGNLPPIEQSILLRQGEILVLTRDLRPGHPAVRDQHGRISSPATIGCTLPEVFDDVRPGESIWLDDGTIGGVVRRVSSSEMQVEITHAREQGGRLGPDKGINLPDSKLKLPALTPHDIAILPMVATQADMVGYSFVRSAADVAALREQLLKIGGEHLGIVLKIETRAAVERLPELLLAAMHSPVCGVMIARGDLAVECGYERMAELQEEILCIAEAAHMPVIWATQVLERLAQEGLPSRAEISDAAMGERAECVMLNKGPYIVEAVRALDDILRRMQDHQSKRSARLRRLRLARAFWE